MSSRFMLRAKITIVLVVAIAVIFLSGENTLTAETRSKSASFNASVASQIWTGIKLSNMNAGATLNIEGKTSDRLAVFLFFALEDEEFLPIEDAAVSVVSDTDFNFDYELPADGDYVLVLDNRDGLVEISYDVTATVSIELP